MSGAQGRAWDYVQLADATDAEGARWVVLSVSDPEEPFMLVRRTPGSAQALCVDCRSPSDVRQALQEHLGSDPARARLLLQLAGAAPGFGAVGAA